MTLAPDIRSNVIANFPSLVVASGPVTLGKQNGVWTVGFNFLPLGNIPPGYNPATQAIMTQNTGTGVFNTITLSQAFNAATGAWQNTRLAKTATYTVGNADKGSTIALGGNAFYQLNFPAVGSVDANFVVRVVNEDAGRAKYLSFVGAPAFYLWPGQSVFVYASGAVWQTSFPGSAFGERWRLPGNITVNVDPVNGSDTLGVADGLGTGTGAFRTISFAVEYACTFFDWSSQNETQVTVLLAAGATDTSTAHFSPHALSGGHGTAALTIDLNGGTWNAAGGCLQLFFGAVVRLRNGTVQSSGSDAIGVTQGGKLHLLDGITFGTTAGAHMDVQSGGFLQINNNYSISGNATFHIQSIHSEFSIQAVTITFTANVTFTNTVYCAQGRVGGVPTWALGGHTVTATNKYNVLENGVLEGSAAVPGSGAGVTASGGQAV